MENVVIYEMPKLNSPYLIAGFEGWSDAGGVSTGVVGYLRQRLMTKKFAEFNSDNFYIFQSHRTELSRPSTVIENGLVKELTFPSSLFSAWQNEKTTHDLVLLFGAEPHLRWHEYAESALDLAQKLGVEMIYSIGGTYDKVPHTREPIVSAVVNDSEIADELRKYDIKTTDYKGPSSIHTLLLVSAGERGIKAASLWGHAPHYIQAPNAKVCHSILKKLTTMLKIELDLNDVREASEHLDEQINKVIEQRPELSEYLRRLEEEYKVAGGEETDELLAEDIIKEVEELLRKKEE
jgi:proteasome assembly chaperone (PAC2) family protein